MCAELGSKTDYRAMTERMVQSAQSCMSARMVRLDAPELTRSQLMLQRVDMLKQFAKRADGHVVMCDVDLEWQNSPEPLFDANDFDIGLAWTSGNRSMPYCGALVLVRHGSEAADRFLTNWVVIYRSLPKETWAWWGDQIALAIMLGLDLKPGDIVNKDGARVKIFDGGDLIFPAKHPNQIAPKTALAKHYKGELVKKELAA